VGQQKVDEGAGLSGSPLKVEMPSEEEQEVIM
jgi:hypothetical protein